MSKYTEIFDYLRKCPYLSDLWSIGAREDAGTKVVLPAGTSPVVQYDEQIDVYGNYDCDVIPYPSVYEDYEINCYQMYDTGDESAPEANVNVLNLEQVQGVCDWIAEQDESGNLPEITGKKVVSVECNPFIPQIRYVNKDATLIAYFVTIRIRYVNTRQRKQVHFYGCQYRS